MGKITNRINELLNERERVKDQIVEFTILKDDYVSGRRDMYEDYPKWRHLFHRTPMDWVNYRISSSILTLKDINKKIAKLTAERDWYEVTDYRYFDIDSIENTIMNGDTIIGIKL